MDEAALEAFLRSPVGDEAAVKDDSARVSAGAPGPGLVDEGGVWAGKLDELEE